MGFFSSSTMHNSVLFVLDRDRIFNVAHIFSFIFFVCWFTLRFSGFATSFHCWTISLDYCCYFSIFWLFTLHSVPTWIRKILKDDFPNTWQTTNEKLHQKGFFEQSLKSFHTKKWKIVDFLYYFDKFSSAYTCRQRFFLFLIFFCRVENAFDDSSSAFISKNQPRIFRDFFFRCAKWNNTKQPIK